MLVGSVPEACRKLVGSLSEDESLELIEEPDVPSEGSKIGTDVTCAVFPQHGKLSEACRKVV